MTISFNDIPNSMRVPFVYVEFNNSGAVQGASVMPYKVLILGQKIATGTMENDAITRVSSADQVKAFAGAGSLLHLMGKRYFQNNNFTETYIVSIADAVGGIAASGTILVSGIATRAGSLCLYIGGKRVVVGITANEGAMNILTAIAAAINADKELPVTATEDSVMVTLTCRWKGQTGNDIDIRLNYYDGDITPAGLTINITQMTGGTINPDITDTLALLGNQQYNIIINPYTDSANLTTLQNELSIRWGATVQKEGFAFMAKNATLANLATFGNGQNTQFFCTIGSKGSPSPSFEWAAALGAVVAFYGNIDPARPFQTLELKGIMAPALSDRFMLSESNSLLFDGISTYMVDAGGAVLIQRLITMYQKNAMGEDDISYLDLNTVLTLAYIRYDFRNMMLNKYPRHKLASDGAKFGLGQAVITPKVAKAEAIARARLWEEMGLVENIDAFKAGLIAERNPADPNRLDMKLTPDVMNQFLVCGVQIGFLL